MRSDGITKQESRTDNQLELKFCVWMMAGVISFKLCPIDYDCERCDFDRVLRMKKPLGDYGTISAAES